MSEVQSSPCFLTPRLIQPHYPLFVFLPGMDGTGQLLRVQTSGLEAAFDVRCLAIPPDDLTSWDGLVEQVVNLIQEELKQAPNRPVYLCGESFGGCLAIKVALYAPDLFDRIILVNPASSFSRRPWIAWGSQITRWLPEAIYQTSSLVLMPLLANIGRIAIEDRQAFVDAVQSVPQKTSIWRMALLGEFQVPEDQLKHLKKNVLLIASVADRLLPSLSECRYLKQTIPTAQLVVLPHSGHACLLEAEVNLYEIMKAHGFLMEQRSESHEGRTASSSEK